MRASCQCDSSAFFCPLSYSSATRIGKLCSVINKFTCKGKLVEAWSYENRNGNYRFMGRLLCCETSATIDNMIGVDFLSMYGMTSVPFDECDQVDALHNFVILELFWEWAGSWHGEKQQLVFLDVRIAALNDVPVKWRVIASMLLHNGLKKESTHSNLLTLPTVFGTLLQPFLLLLVVSTTVHANVCYCTCTTATIVHRFDFYIFP